LLGSAPVVTNLQPVHAALCLSLTSRAWSGSALARLLIVIVVCSTMCLLVAFAQGHKANKQAAHDAKHALVLEKTEKVTACVCVVVRALLSPASCFVAACFA
jgi:hypothetical protein